MSARSLLPLARHIQSCLTGLNLEASLESRPSSRTDSSQLKSRTRPSTASAAADSVATGSPQSARPADRCGFACIKVSNKRPREANCVFLCRPVWREPVVGRLFCNLMNRYNDALSLCFANSTNCTAPRLSCGSCDGMICRCLFAHYEGPHLTRSRGCRLRARACSKCCTTRPTPAPMFTAGTKLIPCGAEQGKRMRRPCVCRWIVGPSASRMHTQVTSAGRSSWGTKPAY